MIRSRPLLIAGSLLFILAACASPVRHTPSARPAADSSPTYTAKDSVVPEAPAPPPIQSEVQKPTPLEPARNVFFSYRSTRVPKEALPVLAEIAQALKADRLRHVTLIAHADHHGSKEFSVALADMRAAAVQAELVKLGARPTQIRKWSRGSEMTPSAGCNTEPCRQKMRRVELLLSER